MELTITSTAVIMATLSMMTAVIGWASLSQVGGVTTADLHMQHLEVKEIDVGLFVETV